MVITNKLKKKVLEEFNILNYEKQIEFLINNSSIYSNMNYSKIFNIKLNEVIDFFIKHNVKYCIKCKNIHKRSFFSSHKNSNDGLDSSCQIHKIKNKNKAQILKLINLFKTHQSWTEQKTLNIKLYKLGLRYQTFASIYNTSIIVIVKYFKNYNIKYCHSCNRLLKLINFSNSYLKTSDGLKTNCRECNFKYNQNLANYDTYNNKIKIYEETRRDPKNYKLIQVKCKQCKKWMNPTNTHIRNRIQIINFKTNQGESSFYCTDKCKQLCPVYGQITLFKNQKKQINRDVNYQNQLRQMRIEKIYKKNNKLVCEFCNVSEFDEDLICHHIIPVSIDSVIAYDIDNVRMICKPCDILAHEIPGCSTSELVKIGKENSKCIE